MKEARSARTGKENAVCQCHAFRGAWLSQATPPRNGVLGFIVRYAESLSPRPARLVSRPIDGAVRLVIVRGIVRGVASTAPLISPTLPVPRLRPSTSEGISDRARSPAFTASRMNRATLCALCVVPPPNSAILKPRMGTPKHGMVYRPRHHIAVRGIFSGLRQGPSAPFTTFPLCPCAWSGRQTRYSLHRAQFRTDDPSRVPLNARRDGYDQSYSLGSADSRRLLHSGLDGHSETPFNSLWSSAARREDVFLPPDTAAHYPALWWAPGFSDETSLSVMSGLHRRRRRVSRQGSVASTLPKHYLGENWLCLWGMVEWSWL